MKKLYDLRDTLMDGLEDFDTIREGRLKMGELEALNLLTDTVKNVDKICMLEDGGSYSQAGDWEMEGRGRGTSYRGMGDRGGQGYANVGDYSRRGRRRDRMGRYSSEGGKEEMMEHLDEMIEVAPDDRTREMIREFKEKIAR